MVLATWHSLVTEEARWKYEFLSLVVCKNKHFSGPRLLWVTVLHDWRTTAAWQAGKCFCQQRTKMNVQSLWKKRRLILLSGKEAHKHWSPWISITVHLADICCQLIIPSLDHIYDVQMQTNSSSWKPLLTHGESYSSIFCVCSYCIFPNPFLVSSFQDWIQLPSVQYFQPQQKLIVIEVKDTGELPSSSLQTPSVKLKPQHTCTKPNKSCI